ncbi:PREDICTED: ER degradation-enhancing alpha-mannosidase-like protein 2 [Priapulus caudatus]|uniref:alpha-1,2-Mannosidase n=1 Tax=Priapulus caudatus TaxID=37621 RepID=A0ABM1DP31_PRICU|nr:PREDICTED: ER degradation-enhancing alpha-mannosidase-like protein 2 [Priapulus caudatus]
MAAPCLVLQLFLAGVFLVNRHTHSATVRVFTENEITKYRERVSRMFHHAYDSYIQNAYPYDELRPLTCDGFDTWGSFSLSLIDALDTLAVLGNYSEFRRVAHLLIDKANFDIDVNVSVFETNIRVVGGLLSAHLLSHRAGMQLEDGWPCSGPLLRLAENVANRLLPAFDTYTGMPYGTVNLRHGVPSGETTVTCTAGVGTFIVEFGSLSQLTGDQRFQYVALQALKALWKYRSNVSLVGNHIDVQSGEWTASEAGIGAGVDSYFEYLVKGAIMFQKPELMDQFREYYGAIQRYLNRDDWYFWASMDKGQITLPVFQNLEAFWPGLLTLVGELDQAKKSLHNYHQVWKQFGFTPEFYNVPTNEARKNREGYPLRPELIESTMYLYQATRDPVLLQVGVDILESIEHSAKTSCGYATIHNVNTHSLDNRMESFFLSETTKYLYLLFDPDNFIHNTGSQGTVIQTAGGECVIDAGGYIFNTEAHPLDMAAVYCCSTQKAQDDVLLQEFHDQLDLLALLDLTDSKYKKRFRKAKQEEQEQDTVDRILSLITTGDVFKHKQGTLQRNMGPGVGTIEQVALDDDEDMVDGRGARETTNVTEADTGDDTLGELGKNFDTHGISSGGIDGSPGVDVGGGAEMPGPHDEDGEKETVDSITQETVEHQMEELKRRIVMHTDTVRQMTGTKIAGYGADRHEVVNLDAKLQDGQKQQQQQQQQQQEQKDIQAEGKDPQLHPDSHSTSEETVDSSSTVRPDGVTKQPSDLEKVQAAEVSKSLRTLERFNDFLTEMIAKLEMGGSVSADDQAVLMGRKPLLDDAAHSGAPDWTTLLRPYADVDQIVRTGSSGHTEEGDELWLNRLLSQGAPRRPRSRQSSLTCTSQKFSSRLSHMGQMFND